MCVCVLSVCPSLSFSISLFLFYSPILSPLALLLYLHVLSIRILLLSYPHVEQYCLRSPQAGPHHQHDIGQTHESIFEMGMILDSLMAALGNDCGQA